MNEEEEYRKIMIKQKEEFNEFKKKEGDSDMIFNNKEEEIVLSKTRDMPEEES